MNLKRQPIGVDDYKKIIDLNLNFTDKTLLIKDIIDDGSEIILIARPRRFGKTLNLSLLRYFFEKSDKDYRYLFKDFKIWQQGDYYLQEFGRYPVISLTLKDLKSSDWALNYEKLCITLSSLYCNYPHLLKSDVLQGSDKEIFQLIFDGKATRPMYEKALSLLCKTLSLYHDEKVVILLDEYDALLNEAYIHGFFDDAIAFMRPFLSETFKNNIYLRKGVLTGIFRVAKESIFSDMNNLKVCTMLSDDYREYFGFTEDEVRQMLIESEISETLENVASWYNGYVFGETKPTTIYNPWSIIMYLENKTLRPYWINTSGNAIIRKLATESNPNIQLSIQTLLEGGTLEHIKIDENIIYSEILKSETAMWSFMLMSGYLKTIKTTLEGDGLYCTLVPPNLEVYYFFRNMMESWFNETIKGGSVNQIIKALLTGDLYTFNEIFARTVLTSVSFNDVGDDTSENFYHAFILGMLVHIDKAYEVRSNRESGFGRYDVMIIPKDLTKKGIIIEFKKASQMLDESLEEALEAALRQIESKNYDTELRALGVSDVFKIAIAFKGKKVKMKILE